MKTKSRTPWAVRLAALAMVAVLAVGGSADAQVRISQFYGGGGNVSATYLSDYVELYNAGTSPQSLGGWSVQYASSTGTSWTVNALPSALLQPGQYFLVKEADGTSITGNQVPALPTPDVIFAISMSATDAKVALCSTTVALIGGTPTVAANPQLVDFVGLGTLANWNEPATLGAAFSNANNAPAPSNNYAIFRRGCGYQDINNNAQDFVRGFPSPRNTATVLNNGMSGGGAAAPMYVEPMFTTRLTVTPALCGTGELPPGTTVTANLTLIGGPAAQSLNDNGILGDEQAGDGIFSYLAAIAPGTLAGTKNLPVTFGGGGGGGGAYISLVVEPATNPDNDNAATAQPIPGPPYADVAGLFTGATVEWNPIVALPTAPSNGMSYRRGLWYTVMGTGNTMTASLCQSLPSFDSVLIVMAGTPDGLTVVANGDDNGPACTGSQASASWCSLSGLTYYVWIAPYSTGAQTYAFVLRISDDGIPCATAVPISFCTLTPAPGAIVEQEPGYGPFNNDGCSEPASANRFRDIGVLGPTVVNIAGNVRVYGGNRDIDEYRFQAGLSDLLTVSITSQMSAAADIYSLSPGGVCPATLITSSGATQRCTPATASTSLTAGNWYVLRISAMPTASSASILGGDTVGATSYNYIGSLLVGGPPPNDNCSSATVIATGGTGSAGVIGNNVGATLDGAPIACGVPVAKDVWYSFQPNATASWDISTCNATDFDTVIEVLDACYGAVVACNDDALGCGDGTQSKLSVGLTGGVTYWIRVCAKLPPGTGGSFNLVVVRTPPPNDWCAGAIPIGEVVNLPFDTTVATTDGIGTHSIYKDIWYCYTPTCSGTVTVDLCGSTFDTKLAVWGMRLPADVGTGVQRR